MSEGAGRMEMEDGREHSTSISILFNRFPLILERITQTE
jgi:hypothetical protein